MTIETVYFNKKSQNSLEFALEALGNGTIDTLGLTFESTECREKYYSISESLYPVSF
jgi:hypothetical protein